MAAPHTARPKTVPPDLLARIDAALASHEERGFKEIREAIVSALEDGQEGERGEPCATESARSADGGESASSLLGDPVFDAPWIRGAYALAAHDVFVSYAQADAKEYATALGEALRREWRFRVFIDRTGLAPGDELSPTIRRRARAARLMVVLLSSAALGSRWMPFEAREALFGGHPLVGIDIAGTWATVAPGAPIAALLGERLRLEEPSKTTPSRSVIEGIERAFRGTRFRTRVTVLATVLLALVATLATVAAWKTLSERDERIASLVELGRVDLEGGHPRRALSSLAEAYHLDPRRLATRTLVAAAAAPFDAEIQEWTGVRCLDAAPAGKSLVMTTSDHRVTKIDGETGRVVWRRAVPGGGDGCVRVLPDDRTLVAGRTIEIWSDDGTTTALANGPEAPLTLAASANGRWIAVGARGGLTLIDRIAGRTDRVASTSGNPASGIEFSARGFLAARIDIADKRGIVVAPDTEPTRSVLELPNAGADVFSFSPNGALFARSNSNTVVVYDASGQFRSSEYRGHVKEVYALAWSPDGRFLLSAGRDGTARIWGIGEATSYVLSADRAPIRAVAWTSLSGSEGRSCGADPVPRDGIVASGSEDGVVRLWDPVSLRILGAVEVGRGNGEEVAGLFFLGGGTRLLAWTSQGGAVLWDVDKLSNRREVIRLPDWANRPLFSPDGDQVVLLGGVSAVLKRSRGTFRCLEKHGDGGDLYGAYSPRGDGFVLGDVDGVVHLYSSDGATERVVGRFRDSVTWVDYEAGGDRFVAASADGTAVVYSGNGAEQFRMQPPDGPAGHLITAAGFLPDGRVVTLGPDWSRICSRDGASCASLSAPGAILIAPAGRLVARTPLRLVSAERPGEARPLGDDVIDDSVSFSSDGARMAAAVDRRGTLAVWDLAAGRQIMKEPIHGEEINATAFSVDGRLATFGSDWATVVLDPQRRERVATLYSHTGQVLGGGFSPDGSTLVTAGGGDGQFVFWDVHLEARRPEAIDAIIRRR